ncbi:MAG: alanine racemase [Gammaproteobacteria bacterium]|nr:alanine racemase [Gammaproteobacteria bacterium]
MSFSDLKTPSLILDREVLLRNCAAMSQRMRRLGVRLRPHMKTAKSAAVAELATEGNFGGITVSTLAEAAYFAARGFRDVTYAVGIVPAKVDEAAEVARTGCRLSLITDDLATIREVAARAESLRWKQGTQFPVLIEIDTGGTRGGVLPDSDALIETARFLTSSNALELEGVLTHAGHSYHSRDVAEVRRIAKQERDGITRAAARLRGDGMQCPVVSGGSTPTATHVEDLEGVTEMRPGVYMFGDLDQVALGSCAVEDVALSVLATVIGQNRRAGRILIDAGALALSKDVSANAHRFNHALGAVGYGRIVGFEGLYVESVHQEHGLIAAADGVALRFDELAIGQQLRILPNHACITAAAHACYHVVEGDDEVLDEWDRVNGW